MNQILTRTGLCMLVTCATLNVLAKDNNANSGPLAGTWECLAHRGSESDLPFTLDLQQNEESVSGSVKSVQGSVEISGTFKKDTLEIHFATDQGKYVLTAKLKENQLVGEWAHTNPENNNTAKGTWDGKKKPPSNQ